MGRLKKMLALLLAAPLALVLVIFDIVKLPVLLPAALIWGLMDLIAVLRGEDSMFLSIMAAASLMGTMMAMELLGIPEPRWMERL